MSQNPNQKSVWIDYDVNRVTAKVYEALCINGRVATMGIPVVSRDPERKNGWEVIYATNTRQVEGELETELRGVLASIGYTVEQFRSCPLSGKDSAVKAWFRNASDVAKGEVVEGLLDILS